MLSRLLLIVFAINIPLFALATEQEKDLVIVEGQHVYTFSLLELNEIFPHIRFPEFEMISTGNRKGYRATWATFQNQLYLVGIEGRIAGKTDLLRNNELLLGQNFPVKVAAWSGTIVQKNESSEFGGEPTAWSDVTKTTTITVTKGVVTNHKVTIKRTPRNDAS
ncbi:MAG TPA: hypothetical protein VFG20_13515 [Planctomycetaceae bacterium]|nr:hypothetical protein [Planctomycetaceae bacterium]